MHPTDPPHHVCGEDSTDALAILSAGPGCGFLLRDDASGAAVGTIPAGDAWATAMVLDPPPHPAPGRRTAQPSGAPVHDAPAVGWLHQGSDGVRVTVVDLEAAACAAGVSVADASAHLELAGLQARDVARADAGVETLESRSAATARSVHRARLEQVLASSGEHPPSW